MDFKIESYTYDPPKTVPSDQIIYHGKKEETDPCKQNESTNVYKYEAISNLKTYDTPKTGGSGEVIYHGSEKKEANSDQTYSSSYNYANTSNTQIYDVPKTVDSNQVIYHGSSNTATNKEKLSKMSNIDLKQMLKDLQAVALSHK